LIDVPVSAWFHAHPDATVTAFMLFVTQWHSTSGILLMSAVLGVLLWRAGRQWWLLSLLLSVPGGLLLNVLVKNVVQRQRPHFDDALLTLNTYSFPSGHTAGATVFYGFLTLLLFTHAHDKPRRILIALAAAGMVLLVGLSRIYLGVHYVSDVVGAVVEGLLWVALCQAGVRALQRRRTGAPA
jgi:membrane-associated phospholipid phosphatase